ncbi:hypothetical protein PPYR_14133 [Photinus pyralis]|uniref:Ig-like domain-containing protein n=1 Tax=Photinus pyralis TaxID=7054 RepID=A0A1Y1LLE0_PHOPY|nr:uncharacterized protein LOC116180941 [Photinus pyralis]KAB0792174.1 hypothetical protein PPYR_14133 [Photinus pyralis]
MKRELFSYLLLAILNHGAAIRITRLVVPTVASFGSLINLDCAYDLENDKLYDVKWYKDSDEFFRCKSDGQVQAFEVEGIDLYKNYKVAVGSCPVTITILNSKSAGKYLCEISSEAPEFKTVARWVNLRIASPTTARRTQEDDTPTQTENHPEITPAPPASVEASVQLRGHGNRLGPNFVSAGVCVFTAFCVLNL